MQNNRVGHMTAVAALPKDLQFISDSQDVQVIRDYLGERAGNYDAFFCRVQNGDYAEVWGICGIVPYNSKLTTRLI